MNIVYYSKLHGVKYSGMTYSVPSQIEYQSKYDNVLWINLSEHKLKTPNDMVECHTIINKKDYKISNLPEPFNRPDLVVFQGVYYFEYIRISSELRRLHIPYIIIPRSSLTNGGQAYKPLKKKIGNLLFFYRFIKGAAAIQYLTEQEKIDSGEKWNGNSFIIPNGINAVSSTNIKKYSQLNNIKGVFIGRIRLFQKGLDLLIEACEVVQHELRQNNVSIDIYGPGLNGSVDELNQMINSKGIEDIIKIKGPVYDQEKITTLLQYDFFILPSRFEGHPMGLIEALAHGLPSLVTVGSNMADEIKEMNAGWASDTSVSGIVESFQKLIKDKYDFENKSKNAIALVKKYNWHEIAKDSHKIYSDLLKHENSCSNRSPLL